jgi:hypothetical protein
MRRQVSLRAALLAFACGAAAASAQQAASTKGAAGLAPIESIQVSGNGEGAVFKTKLEPGELYLLKAAGAVVFASQRLDAEYVSGSPAGADAADKIAAVDVGIDVGVKEVLPATHRTPAPPSENRVKWFGDYRTDHTYYLLVTGAGESLSLKLAAPSAADKGAGAITVSLFRLDPEKMGDPLETVNVPAREKIAVASKINVDAGAVYLLQAVGEVQVGGPGKMGDAEFHDYHADGTGANEGEGGVDFGVGVDEPFVAVQASGSGHVFRKFKWGPYRTDHAYAMLYSGTGKPISFNYHDTGGKSGAYLDNQGSLPVRIFRAP